MNRVDDHTKVEVTWFFGIKRILKREELFVSLDTVVMIYRARYGTGIFKPRRRCMLYMMPTKLAVRRRLRPIRRFAYRSSDSIAANGTRYQIYSFYDKQGRRIIMENNVGVILRLNKKNEIIERLIVSKEWTREEVNELIVAIKASFFYKRRYK